MAAVGKVDPPDQAREALGKGEHAGAEQAGAVQAAGHSSDPRRTRPESVRTGRTLEEIARQG
jgi:hypothetical protein